MYIFIFIFQSKNVHKLQSNIFKNITSLSFYNEHENNENFRKKYNSNF